MKTRLIATAVIALVALTGCGSKASSNAPVAQDKKAATMPTTVPGAAGKVSTRGLVTILSLGDKPAELCLGGVAESLPPQCGGPELVGWQWSEHPGSYEKRGTTRWALYAVTGTFDGTKFTPDEVIPSALYDAKATDADGPDFTTPCPTPSGGWKVINPALTTDDTMSATFAAAEHLPGYADAWMDQTRAARHPNDPKLVTINVRVTEDVAGAEAALRKIWGGALCVTTAEHTQKELSTIQDAVTDLPGMLEAGASNGAVEVTVTYDDGSIQDWADATFGPGLVKVSSALQLVHPEG